MEEYRRPNPQPSNIIEEDTATVDDKEVATTSQTQTLVDSVDAMELDTQVDLESHDVERSSKKSQDSVLDENLEDILDLENRIAELVEPSTDPIVLEERVPWFVQSDLLQAMFNISTQRQLGGALMQCVDALRLRTDLTDSLKNHRLQGDLKTIIDDLKKIVVIEKTRKDTLVTPEETEQQKIARLNAKLDEQKLIIARRKVFKEMVNACNVHEEDQKSLIPTIEGEICEIIFQDIDFKLSSTGSNKVEKDKIKATFKDLYAIALEISSAWRYSIPISLNNYCGGMEKEKIRLKIRNKMKKAVKEISELARGLQSICQEHEKDRIEKAVRELVLQTLNLFDITDQVMLERRSIEEIQISEMSTPSLAARVPKPQYSRSRLVPTFRSPVVGGVTSATVEAIASGAGTLAGPLRAGIGPMQAASGWWWRNACTEEEIEILYQSNPVASSVSYTPLGLVATPFSNPLYLKGSGGGSGSGGSSGSGSSSGSGGSSAWEARSGSGGSTRSSRPQWPGGRDWHSRWREDRSRPDPVYYPEYSQQYLEASRLISEGINDLCRILSQISGIQNDCHVMLHLLEIHDAILHCGQPTSSLSYAECMDQLFSLRASIVLLNNDQPMARIEFFRTLRFVISAVCKTFELAAQCGYFLTLLQNDLAVAMVGVVDVQRLRKTVRAAQFTCYKMLQFTPEQAKEEADQLNKQVEDLLKALADASRRSLNLCNELEGAAADLKRTAEALELDSRENISITIILLLNSIQTVGVLTEHPKMVPIAANTSYEAHDRRKDVLKSARILYNKAELLVRDAMAHENLMDDSRLMTWVTGMDVDQEFEELVVAIRKNGHQAGIIQDPEMAESAS